MSRIARPWRAADDFGAEQALERLAGQQVLAGEVGVEGQELVVCVRRELHDRQRDPMRGRVHDLEPDRSRRQLDSAGS